MAGVIGESKFHYDLWGDTVNIASRMESHGEAGKVHISGATYELLNSIEVPHQVVIDEAVNLSHQATERFPLMARMWLERAMISRAAHNQTAEID